MDETEHEYLKIISQQKLNENNLTPEICSDSRPIQVAAAPNRYSREAVQAYKRGRSQMRQLPQTEFPSVTSDCGKIIPAKFPRGRFILHSLRKKKSELVIDALEDTQ